MMGGRVFFRRGVFFGRDRGPMRAAAKSPEGGAQDGAAARPMGGRLWVDRAAWEEEDARTPARSGRRTRGSITGCPRTTARTTRALRASGACCAARATSRTSASSATR